MVTVPASIADATMPYVIVLAALLAETQAALYDQTVNDRAITVRHHRHRESRSDELPSVALRFISADVSSRFGRQEGDGGLPEQVMELVVNFVIDAELVAESDEGDDESGDPSGYEPHAQIMGIILDRLMPDQELGAEPNTLGGVAWDMLYDGTAPEEGDASPDAARLEERMTILYRVRADRPTTLLRGA